MKVKTKKMKILPIWDSLLATEVAEDNMGCESVKAKGKGVDMNSNISLCSLFYFYQEVITSAEH